MPVVIAVTVVMRLTFPLLYHPQELLLLYPNQQGLPKDISCISLMLIIESVIFQIFLSGGHAPGPP